jgi:hypothetical protein
MLPTSINEAVMHDYVDYHFFGLSIGVGTGI